MAHLFISQPEPIEIVQRVRELLEAAGAHLEPIIYECTVEDPEFRSSRPMPWLNHPQTIKVQISFEIDILPKPEPS